MAKSCFICNQKFGFWGMKFSKPDIEKMGLELPEAMGENDKLCTRCYKENYAEILENRVYSEEEKKRQDDVIEQTKKDEKDVKKRQKEKLEDLAEQAKTLKKKKTRSTKEITLDILKAQQKKKIRSTKEVPLDILKVRLAKGEITKEEFEEMKRSMDS